MAQRDANSLPAPPGSDGSDSPAIGPDAIFAGRYVLGGEIGRGGMGRGFRAHDLRLSRDVAVKGLFPGPPDETQLRRVTREARGAGFLNPPSIVGGAGGGGPEGGTDIR